MQATILMLCMTLINIFDLLLIDLYFHNYPVSMIGTEGVKTKIACLFSPLLRISGVFFQEKC